MEWAQKRKIFYITVFVGIAALLVSYPTYLIFHKEPTCFDFKQNGAESGVDCGGGCARMCSFEVRAPRVVWANVFSIGENLYDLGAYIENVNVNAGVKNMQYTARVFDDTQNVLIEKMGTIDLVPASATLLFETNITFSGTPSRVEVEFNPEDLARWTKASVAPHVVLTKNQSLTSTDTKPRFDAVLVNTDSVDDVAGLTVGAVVYDISRNPVAVSRTYVDLIQRSTEQNIFFTWPSKFTSNDGSYITEIVITPRAVFAE